MKVVFDFTQELLRVQREPTDEYGYNVTGLLRLLCKTLNAAGLQLKMRTPVGELPYLEPATNHPQAQFTVHPIRRSASQYTADGNTLLRLTLLTEFLWYPAQDKPSLSMIGVTGHVIPKKSKRVKNNRRPSGCWPLESLPKSQTAAHPSDGESAESGLSEGGGLDLVQS